MTAAVIFIAYGVFGRASVRATLNQTLDRRLTGGGSAGDSKARLAFSYTWFAAAKAVVQPHIFGVWKKKADPMRRGRRRGPRVAASG
jgi:hypothetical protein